MDTIFQFCTMWQNLFTNPRSLGDWAEIDVENIIAWARCCEKAIVEDLKLTDDGSSTEEDLANFNAAVVDQFMYLPPSTNYALDLANATRNIITALVQNPYLSDKLLNNLIRVLAKNDSSLAEFVASSVEECVREKNLLEMVLSHQVFKDIHHENLPLKAKAAVLAKRLICIWTLSSTKKFVTKNDESPREKAVKTVLAEHLKPSSPITCLYLLREVAPVDQLNELVYNETLSQQQLAFDCENISENNEILAQISAKYPGFFNAYLLFLLRQLNQVEGSALDDQNATALLERIAEKMGTLAKKTDSRIYSSIRRLLIERRDRPLCERRDIYDHLLEKIQFDFLFENKD